MLPRSLRFQLLLSVGSDHWAAPCQAPSARPQSSPPAAEHVSIQTGAFMNASRLLAPCLVALIAVALMAACADNASGPDAPGADGAEVGSSAESTATAATGACNDDGSGPSCDWQPTDNGLIVRVSGETFGTDEVLVEYSNEDAGRFQTRPVSVQDGVYEVPVARLRPETSYDFQVLGVSESGETLPGPNGTFTTGSLPPGLQRAEVEVITGKSTSELTFMDLNAHEFEGHPSFFGLVAIDGDGEIVWYVETGETNAMAQKPDGNIVFLDYASGLREITPLGEEVAFVDSPCNPIVFHHEVEVLPDGRILTLSFDVVDAFDDPSRLQVADTIWAWDQSKGSVGKVWSLLDVEDPLMNRTESSGLDEEGFMWRGCNSSLPTEDWSHGNAVKAAPDGSMIVSSRHLNQVHSITSDFEGLNWRLGGHGSDFTFPEPSDQFYHQHTASQLPNGNVLLFDNGNSRPDEEGGEYSRALELELDFESGTARKVWEYAGDPTLYAECCSSTERLENGNTLIVFGSNMQEDVCCRVHTIVEATPGQEAAWRVEVKAPGQNVLYRVYSGDSILGERHLPA
ncbi:MAG: hypothetical protein GEU80_15600 [Dehalococcoidia bacterium]|nr:hypothetical protein [Dehalococcoidia bacterium]